MAEHAGLIGPAELLRMATVARRFYLDGRSKVQIGEEFGLSRFRVARMLDEARERGLVRIEIVLPAELDSELSDAVRVAYGLKHVLVVATASEPELSLRTHLGQAAAELLTEIVSDGEVLGLGWGRTLNSVSLALHRLAQCTVVQLSGALTSDLGDESSIEMARRVAAVAGGRVFPIYAPLVLPDAATAAGLRQQSQVQAALSRHTTVTKALVAIGSWSPPPNSQLYDALANSERERLIELGVRAEVCGVLLNEQGGEVASELRDRVISVGSEALHSIPEVIAVAGGPTKAPAIRATILGGYASSLVTDTTAARYLLEHRH